MMTCHVVLSKKVKKVIDTTILICATRKAMCVTAFCLLIHNKHTVFLFIFYIKSATCKNCIKLLICIKQKLRNCDGKTTKNLHFIKEDVVLVNKKRKKADLWQDKKLICAPYSSTILSSTLLLCASLQRGNIISSIVQNIHWM